MWRRINGGQNNVIRQTCLDNVDNRTVAKTICALPVTCQRLPARHGGFLQSLGLLVRSLELLCLLVLDQGGAYAVQRCRSCLGAKKAPKGQGEILLLGVSGQSTVIVPGCLLQV